MIAMRIHFRGYHCVLFLCSTEKVNAAQRCPTAKEFSEEEVEGSVVDEMYDRYVNVLRFSTPIPSTLPDGRSSSGVRDAANAKNLGKDFYTSLDSLAHLNTQLASLSPTPDATLALTLHSLSASYTSNSSLYNSDPQTTSHASGITSTTSHNHYLTDGRRRTPNTHHSREVSSPSRGHALDTNPVR